MLRYCPRPVSLPFPGYAFSETISLNIEIVLFSHPSPKTRTVPAFGWFTRSVRIVLVCLWLDFIWEHPYGCVQAYTPHPTDSCSSAQTGGVICNLFCQFIDISDGWYNPDIFSDTDSSVRPAECRKSSVCDSTFTEYFQMYGFETASRYI